ncbi:MAG TPA: LamG-like jellyroll fold domain-containing protein [Kofleriaceae bacterium]|nr:LamG-like jellyroll fold domain-containing protein [Kofleriaceae bacterium]
MRTSILCASAWLALAACSVPDKQPIAGDAGGGSDASSGTPSQLAVPDTKIDAAPPQFSNERTPTFEFSSDPAGATFECRVDNQPAAPCTSPFTRNLGDGSHTFSVRAVNAGGQADDTPAEVVWTIDTVPPDTRITQNPPARDNSVSAVFKFTSTEQGSSFDCSLDNAGFVACKSGDSFGPIGDGTHSLAVRARDRAGNVDVAPAVYAWTVDTSTPDTQIVAGPSGPTGLNTATFSFTSPDAGAGATFACSLDGVAFAACTSPVTLSGLGEGAHTFAVRVRDAVGNVDPTPATQGWTVDLTPPTTAITAGPTGLVAHTSFNVTFVANEDDATFACSLDGAPFAACTSPAALTMLGQGAHAFTVRATDAAGHVEKTPPTLNFTVDTAPPDVTFTSGPDEGATSGPRVTFGIAASDGTLQCHFDNDAFAPCASPIAANLPAGPHTLTVQATDAAGNVEPKTRSWTVACAAPDAAGAAGLLHLDGAGQVLANAVPGGQPASLGDTPGPDATGEPTTTPGRFGAALAFLASDGDRVAWPAQLGASPEWTVELWTRPSATAGTHELIGVAGQLSLRAVVTGTQAKLSLIASDAGGPNVVTSSNAVAAGQWHHVIASYKAPSLRLWLDGVRTQADGVTLTTPVALDALTLGGGASLPYDGALDEVWLAQTAITGDEAALTRYCPAP